MALIGVHRLERDVAAVPDDLARDLRRQTLKRLLALETVVLGIDIDAHALGLAAVDGVVRQMLDGVERLAAAADQNAEIFTDQIDHIGLVGGLGGVRHGVGAHVLQQTLDKLLDLFLDRAGLGGGVDLRLGRSALLGGCLRRLRSLRLLRLALRARLGLARGLRLLRLGLGTGLRHGRRGRCRSGGRDDLRCGGRLLHGLFGLASGGRGERGLGRLVRCFIGHLDPRGLRADAKETGSGIVQHFDRDTVAVHAELLERGCDREVNGLAGSGNEFFHILRYSSDFASASCADAFLP